MSTMPAFGPPIRASCPKRRGAVDERRRIHLNRLRDSDEMLVEGTDDLLRVCHVDKRHPLSIELWNRTCRKGWQVQLIERREVGRRQEGCFEMLKCRKLARHSADYRVAIRATFDERLV
jgi:hypothetical protein